MRYCIALLILLTLGVYAFGEPDLAVSAQQARRERAKMTKEFREQVLIKGHRQCVYCGSNLHLEVDHIFPISKGGKTEINNLQVLCRACNRAKGAKIVHSSNATSSSNQLTNQVEIP